jgi:hypothetical protein
MKDTPVFAAGSPYTFANVWFEIKQQAEAEFRVFIPRHQVFMEGAGVLFRPRFNGMWTTASLMW